MPVPAIVGAVVAIGVAVEVGTAFAVIAAVGATVGAVGAITGVKELTYAGMALGAVGAIGTVASSAGLFAGEAASSLGQVATDAGTWAGAGTEAVNAVAAPAGGYAATMGADGLTTLVDGASSLGGGLGAQAVSAIPPDASIVDVINSGSSNFKELPITTGTRTPNVTPEVLPNAAVEPTKPLLEMPMDPAGEMPEMLHQPQPTASGQYMVDAQQPGLINSPIDPYGNAIAQGDHSAGAGGELGPGVTNPAARPSGDVWKVPTDQGTPAAKIATPEVKVTGNVNDAAAAVTGGAGSPINPQDLGIPGSYDAAARAVGSVGQVQAPNAGSDSVWSKILGYAEKSPALTMGAFMAAGSFLSGAMSPLTPAQVSALDAQAANNLAAANLAKTQDELLQRRLRNMNEPVPVASRTPRPAGMPPGLINSSMPLVTGRPA